MAKNGTKVHWYIHTRSKLRIFETKNIYSSTVILVACGRETLARARPYMCVPWQCRPPRPWISQSPRVVGAVLVSPEVGSLGKHPNRRPKIPLVFFYYVPFPWHIATRNITQNLLLEFCISHAHDKKKCVGIYTFCSPLYLYKGDLHYLIAQNAPVHGVSFSLFYGGRGDNTGLFQVGPNCWIACYKLDTREPRQLHILGLDASHSAY
jgi:hypothetical protein